MFFTKVLEMPEFLQKKALKFSQRIEIYRLFSIIWLRLYDIQQMLMQTQRKPVAKKV